MSAQFERRSGTDRRQERHFRFHNRRGGFDRRRAYPFLRTLRDAPWTLLTILILINLLSALDGMLTAVELANGLAREANMKMIVVRHRVAGLVQDLLGAATAH